MAMSRIGSLLRVVGLVGLLSLLPSFTSASPSDKIVSIPLVSHHTQKRRRQLFTAHKTSHVVDDELRAHCPRFFLQDLLERQQQQHQHDNEGEERGLGVTVNAEQVAALFQGYGTHYADLWCGTPPQRQTVIVDTGSGITAFPCSECHDCGVPKYHIDQLFQERDSSTFRELRCGECLKGHCDHTHCRMGQSYQEGSSWYARESMDRCYVGGLHDQKVDEDDKGTSDLDPYHAPAFAFDLKFGCQNKITGLFKTQMADGIMGMDIAKASFWMQMFNADRIKHKAFSLCFNRAPTASRQGTGAGAMSLGGADERLHNTEMVYSRTDKGVGFYVVHLRKAYLRQGGAGDSALTNKDSGIRVIQLNVDESTLNRGNVIVDSGTTDTYFHKGIAKAFQGAFKSLMGTTLNHKAMKLTEDQLNSYPTILFQMVGDTKLNKAIADKAGAPVPGLAGHLDPENPYDVILAIPPSHYFEYEEGVYTNRFYSDESRGSVLGANAMMGHDVFFDVDNAQIGWAESDCDYAATVAKYFDKKILPGPPDKEPNKREETSKNKEDQRFKPEDADATRVDHKSNQFCTGIRCQVTIAITLVGAIVLIGLRIARGAPASDMEEVHELTDAELEMQTPPSALDNDDYHDEKEASSTGGGSSKGNGYHD